MLFTTWTFAAFLGIVLILYYCLTCRWQNHLLLLASCVFYGWWDWRFLFLIFTVIIVNYLASLGIERDRLVSSDQSDSPADTSGTFAEVAHDHKSGYWLALALVVSLGQLAFFKYFNFFADSTVTLLQTFGFHPSPFTLQILLPVGISFFTFQALAYTIDVYRGRETPCHDFCLFSLYILYFPQLVAGPIERSTHLIPLLAKPREVYPKQIYSACQLMLMGFFKKMFIADGAAQYVNQCFDNPSEQSSLMLLCGMYFFALQIYGDFAGYTDIARGVSRLFGIDLCLNFRQPYLSANITDFWRRWHISLSSWLRDYLYIPLGGNRKGTKRTYINLLLTMLLGGLWHGANWTFVIWGGLHGMFLAIHKWIMGSKKLTDWEPLLQRASYPTRRAMVKDLCKWAICVVFTFHLVCIAWVFFRAESVGQACDYISLMLSCHKIGTWGIRAMAVPCVGYFACIGLLDFFCYLQDKETPFFSEKRWLLNSLLHAFMMCCLLFGANDGQEFIYFQF